MIKALENSATSFAQSVFTRRQLIHDVIAALASTKGHKL